MTIETVTRWRTDDGEEFTDEDAALVHSKSLELESKFPSIYGQYEGCYIDYDEFNDWAEDNLAWLQSYMKTTR